MIPESGLLFWVTLYVRYTSIDIALPLYFLFHYYFRSIVLPYVVNKDFLKGIWQADQRA